MYTRPDQNLISADLQEQCSWDVLDDLGSNQLPILISISMEMEKGKAKRQTAWNYSKAVWDEYRTMTIGQHKELDLEADIHILNREYTNAMLSAATRNVPQGNRAKYSAFWNGDLEEAVDFRKKVWKLKRNNATPENKREYNKHNAELQRKPSPAKQSNIIYTR